MHDCSPPAASETRASADDVAPMSSTPSSASSLCTFDAEAAFPRRRSGKGIETRRKTTASTSPSSLAERRSRVLGENVATVDSSLPAIVAGRGCRLYGVAEGEGGEGERGEGDDDDGDDGDDEDSLSDLVPFLDAQNNVAVVGHSDPDVSRAVSRSMSTLNTNSRYAHPALVEHAEALLFGAGGGRGKRETTVAPESATSVALSRYVEDPVIYYVASGTEANDLALRIARAYHEEAAAKKEESPSTTSATTTTREESSSDRRRHHYLALEGAYHGHAGDAALVSSYCHHGGAVGSPRPPNVSLLPLPDALRGGGFDPAAAIAAAALEARGSGGLTAFIFESFPSCAGQVELHTNNWLARAVDAARESSFSDSVPPPVVVADEVQTGFGRLGPGRSFWAFSHCGVDSVDVVTLGKPAANGFPFGAVVASRRVAAPFARNHPPFFSTFGGCTAAAAAALATLRVLFRDGLPENAAAVGSRLLSELRGTIDLVLSENETLRDNLIVDARGVGLMLGIEFAFKGRGRGLRPAAAPDVASFVAADCRRNSRVLVSVDGAGARRGSVIKVKPPLRFSHGDADELVSALRRALERVPREMLLEQEG